MGRKVLPASRFVFAVAGGAHVAGLAPALEFLRRATRAEIIVVQRAGDPLAAHDQCLAVDVPPGLTQHQAAIWLKTGLHRLIGLEQPFCYLDSDVLALGSEIDAIFTAVPGPVGFAPDHALIDEFSAHAVHCGCGKPCAHLREALFCDFGVDIEPDFHIWNGGVFTARAGAEAFLDDWHEMAKSIWRRPYWRVRDQGVLAGAVWRAGWQRAPMLPERFNTIIDCYDRIPLSRRPTTSAAGLARHERHLPLPDAVAVHLINGGVARAGWPHWDNLAALLREAA